MDVCICCNDFFSTDRSHSSGTQGLVEAYTGLAAKHMNFGLLPEGVYTIPTLLLHLWGNCHIFLQKSGPRICGDLDI